DRHVAAEQPRPEARGGFRRFRGLVAGQLIGVGADVDIRWIDAFGLKARAHLVRDRMRWIKPHQSLLTHVFFPAERELDGSPTAASPRWIKVQPNIRRRPFEASRLSRKPCGGEVHDSSARARNLARLTGRACSKEGAATGPR